MNQDSTQRIGIRVRRKWNGKGLIKLLLIIAALGYLGFLAYNYIGQIITQQMIKVEPAHSGTVEDTVKVTGILLKEETIINSPNKGKVTLVVPEGDRVKIGSLLCKISVQDINSASGQSEIPIYAYDTGVVSYHLDGLESIYTKANIDTLSLGNVPKTPKGLEIHNGDEVESGRPVLKIVNNLARDRIYLTVPQKEFARNFLKKGKRVEVDFLQKGIDPLVFEIDQFKEKGSDFEVILGNNSFIPEFLNQREITFKIVKNSYNGIVVPVKSLVRKDGRDGLFIQYKENVKWIPVTIIGKVGDKAVIDGVEEETPYIVNPELTKEGQVLYNS